MNVYHGTDIGLVRSENQDRVKTAVLGENSAFAVLCDGMGGENAGSEASEKAVEIIFDRFTKVYREDMTGASIKNLLMSALLTANSIIFDIASTSESLRGMGTTCVAALYAGNKLYAASAGDSRIYLINHEIKQVTKDHTVVMRMYENGEISKEEIKIHPQRNYITKAIGVGKDVEPDFYEIDVTENSSALLCSDGLSNYCPEADMFRIVKEHDKNNMADELIEIALKLGGNDNITVAVITP